MIAKLEKINNNKVFFTDKYHTYQIFFITLRYTELRPQ